MPLRCLLATAVLSLVAAAPAAAAAPSVKGGIVVERVAGGVELRAVVTDADTDATRLTWGWDVDGDGFDDGVGVSVRTLDGERAIEVGTGVRLNRARRHVIRLRVSDGRHTTVVRRVVPARR